MPKLIRQDKYQVGDVVNFKADLAHMQMEHGDGPFTIEAVENVPYQRYENRQINSEAYDGCKSNHEGMGHTQLVEIATKRGRSNKLSGFWFEPLR